MLFCAWRLAHEDVFVRTAAAELMAERPASKENIAALQYELEYALTPKFPYQHKWDKEYNDARLAMMDALFKLDKKEAVKTLKSAMNSADYLTRKEGA